MVAGRRIVIRFALAAAVSFMLGGCGAVPALIQAGAALASASTLLKNEANCSLVAISDCTMPHLGAAVPTPPATPGMAVIVPTPVATPDMANLSLDGN